MVRATGPPAPKPVPPVPKRAPAGSAEPVAGPPVAMKVLWSVEPAEPLPSSPKSATGVKGPVPPVWPTHCLTSGLSAARPGATGCR